MSENSFRNKKIYLVLVLERPIPKIISIPETFLFVKKVLQQVAHSSAPLPHYSSINNNT